jgi:hypothetical protein
MKHQYETFKKFEAPKNIQIKPKKTFAQNSATNVSTDLI